MSWWRILFWATCAALVVLALLIGTAAQTQTRMPCGDRTLLMAYLAWRYGETVKGSGLDAAGRSVEVLANAETGTWSMLVTPPGMETCLVRSGSDWQSVDTRPHPGAPS